MPGVKYLTILYIIASVIVDTINEPVPSLCIVISGLVIMRKISQIYDFRHFILAFFQYLIVSVLKYKNDKRVLGIYEREH
jgi:hypothetical protein